MQTQLPVEIIGRIIQLIYLSTSKHSSILPLLLVSPTFRAETERLLYSNISLNSLRQTIRCFQTINSRPNIPRSVRQLHMTLALDSTPPAVDVFDFLAPDGTIRTDEQVRRLRESRARKGRVLRSFGLLVERTLNKLVSLQEYSLGLGGVPREEPIYAPMWLPSNPPFRLRRFMVDLNISPAMVRFLQSQTELVDLIAPGFSSRSPHINLPADALPKLRGVILTPAAAAAIVPGRPVKKLVLRAESKLGVVRMIENVVKHAPAMSRSTVPVKTVDMYILKGGQNLELLLRSLSLHFPQLEQLILRRQSEFPERTSIHETYETDGFTAALGDFKHLKSLHLPSPSANFLLRDSGLLGGGGITIQANINGAIFPGPMMPGPPPAPAAFGPPPPPMPNPPPPPAAFGPPVPPIPAPAPPPPVVYGPPLPPGFQNPNAANNVGNPPPPPPPMGGFFAIPIPLGGGGGGGGAGAGNPLPPPVFGGGPGGLPAFLQNFLALNHGGLNGNGNAQAGGGGLFGLNAAAPVNGNPTAPPPAPVQEQEQGPIVEDEPGFDDLPPLADVPEDEGGEIIADFFLVTGGGPMGEGGNNPQEGEGNSAVQEPQPQQGGGANPQPAQAQNPPGTDNAPPAPLNLGQVLNQATNMIMQEIVAQLAGGPLPANGGAGGANLNLNFNPGPAVPNPVPAAAAPNAAGTPAPATADPQDTDIPELEPIDAPPEIIGAPAPAPPPMEPGPGPLNFHTTLVTAFNPVTGEVVTTTAGADLRRLAKDPKVKAALDTAQKGLRAQEEKILQKWKFGGGPGTLKSVTFEMERELGRKTHWTWKRSKRGAMSSKATQAPELDGDEDVEITNADDVEPTVDYGGQWEVEYVRGAR